MAISNLGQLANGQLFTDTANTNAAVVIKATSAVLYELELDNTANAAASYVKFYNTGTVTVGTTAPDSILMVPATTKITMVFPGGVTFGTALAVATVNSGGTAGVIGPVTPITVRAVYA